ncbi:MAG: PQQ-dependent sugar dehydrogenase [Verrucomicrobiales bacterium]
MVSPRIHWLAALFCVSQIAAQTPPATGSISRHVWTGISGTSVTDLTSRSSYPNSPNSTGTRTSFQGPTNTADNYGSRMFGWIHPVVTGNHVFALHADDNAELWLSTTESPDQRQRIARVPEWTDAGDYGKFPEQVSAAIPLQAGKFYFIEALQKEGGGGDNLGVAWSYTGQSRVIVPGSRLSPWQNLSPMARADAAVVNRGGVVGVNVLVNDSDPNGFSDLNLSSLAIVWPPASGTTSLDLVNGRVIYTHGGGPGSTDTFTYRVRDAASLQSTATVTIDIRDEVRLPLATANLPSQPPATSLGIIDAFPGQTFASPVGLATPPGETDRLFVLEKGGNIELLGGVAGGTITRSVFLDLDTLVNSRTSSPAEVFQTGSEQGLLGLAFHPDYAVNRRFFVVYSLTVGGTRVQRLSEFRASSSNTHVADTTSERVFIQQFKEAGNHNGGDLHFGPDGYLYMSWGDEGNANDTLNNSQIITKDFWSSITRIDVDLEAQDYTASDGTGGDDANLRPNNHAAIVLQGGNPRYEVPADNPWVGATSFLGSAVTSTNVRTEFWAVGLRNPWRMSFDPLTGQLWCADVGQDAREEVNRIVKGGNYEWAFREGTLTGVKWGDRPSGWTGSHPPVYDYSHGSGAMQGNSVSGGIVYRGTRIPSLDGKYLFADYVSANVWSLDPSVTPAVVTRIGGEGAIVAFGRDPSNGDPLLVDHDGYIRRLVQQVETTGFPPTLAATGLFADPVALSPNPGLHAYEINLPFWSDHARKRRWFGQTSLTTPITFAREGAWNPPPGTIWVKHFDLETTRGQPATARRLETRVLVRTASGAYGVSYKWNAAGTSATLADTAGEEIPITITENGQSFVQTWRIPSMAECMVCHSPQAGHALSFRTRQLNREGSMGGVQGNFLSRLFEAGYLTGPFTAPSELPRHAASHETAYSLETRARSYLDVNCAYCHNQNGTVPAAWDASAALKLFQTGLVNAPAGGGTQHPDDRLLVPGQEERSIIVHRAAARSGYTRMPPLGSNVTDQAGVQLLIDWIENELPGRESEAQWRTRIFGSSPQGAPNEDPDGDGRSNRLEFLALTNPLVNDRAPTLGIERRPSGWWLDHVARPGRSAVFESSTDLRNWSRIQHPANNGLPRSPGPPWGFEVPHTGGSEFFRTRTTEE